MQAQREAVVVPAGQRDAELTSLQGLLLAVSTGGGHQAVDALAAALEALSARSPSATESARQLLHALEEPQVATATDSRGQSLRALIVAAVLRVGYPVALEITPDDLAHYRSTTDHFRWRSWRGVAVLLALGLTLAGLGRVAWGVYALDLPTQEAPAVRPAVRAPGPLANAFFTAKPSTHPGFAEMVEARTLFVTDPRASRVPLERCLSADPESLECIRALGSVESYLAARDHDANAGVHARQLYDRYLELAPTDDDFVPEIRRLMMAK